MYDLAGVAGLEPAVTALEAVGLAINRYPYKTKLHYTTLLVVATASDFLTLSLYSQLVHRPALLQLQQQLE